MTGFEPATPATRTRCATKLRYIPLLFNFQLSRTYGASSHKTIHWIVLFGRVKLRYIPLLFNFQLSRTYGASSHKTIHWIVLFGRVKLRYIPPPEVVPYFGTITSIPLFAIFCKMTRFPQCR